MPGPLRLLLVEDSEEDAELVIRELRRGGFEIEARRVDTRQALVSALEDGRGWDIAVSDYALPGFEAPEALALLREKDEDLPVLIVSGTIGEEAAVEALRGGARDFIVKGRLARLVPAVQRELREKEDRAAKRNAEARASDSEDRYRVLFDGCPLPMWVYDKETLVFLAVNDAAVRHYGYTREEFSRMTLRDIRPPEDVPALREAVAGAHGRVEGDVWRHRKKDGSIVNVEIKSEDLALGGAIGRLVVVNDVTARVKLEDQLRQAQ
jgi:PAS domain S-box-containing protein